MLKKNNIKTDDAAACTAQAQEKEAEFKIMEDPELEIYTLEDEEDGLLLAASCMAAGTGITMGDGSLKAVEAVQKGDCVQTFNHEAGKLSENKVYLAYKSPQPEIGFTLHFENGRVLTFVGTHDLFEQESMKYVRISDDQAEEFINRHFYSAADGKFVKLTGISRSETPTDYYCIYTEFDANCIAEGMLTVPDDSDEILNIYDFRPDLSANPEALAADIEKYGLHEFSAKEGVSKEVFDYLGFKYAGLMVGKGFGTWDDFYSRIEEYKRCCH